MGPRKIPGKSHVLTLCCISLILSNDKDRVVSHMSAR